MSADRTRCANSKSIREWQNRPADRPARNKTIVDSYSASGLMLNQVRSQAGYSLRDLGNEIGVNASTLCRLENGKEVGAFSYLAAMIWIDHHKLTKGTMTGPGDIGYGPALDAIEKRLDNIERAVTALARVIEARYNADILRPGDEVIVHELAGVRGYINHDEILKEANFTSNRSSR